MIEEFLNYLQFELRRSPLTVKSYSEDLRSFEAYFENLEGQPTWNTVDSDIVRDWMERMMDKGNNAASVNRRLSALRSFYRFALSRKLVGLDPTRRVEGPKKQKPLPQFLKENEMDRLLDDVEWGTDFESVRARTIVMVFYETGIRVSELVGLDDTAIDFTGRLIKVTGKGDKQRIIPFGEELNGALEAYMSVRDGSVDRHDSSLFPTGKGFRMKSDQVRNEVKRCLSAVSTLKKLSPHVLRHTFATSMLNHGAGIESVRRLLGHESVSTTEIYTHTTFEQLKRVYQEAHPRA